jgi:3-hydroxyisobutyrate dehydrogenase-like beta-hydroxyacid dehydrogenase
MTAEGNPVMQANVPVGIIGLGLMGIALSGRLIDAGISLIGFDIDAARREELEARGGLIASSVADLATRSRTIIVAVYSGEQVEKLLDEITSCGGAEPPTVLCTTTCTPDEITRLAARAANARIPFIEAPISGTSAELHDGGASALVAGDAEAIAKLNALLEILCPHRLHVGAIGDASRTKLALNLILQVNRAGLAEGIVFAECLGLDGHAFLTAACQSAAYSRVMDTKGEKMLMRDYRPQSRISQTLKDAELILGEAGQRGLNLPFTTRQAELLRATIAIEGPDSDSAAVIEAIRQRRGRPEVSR